MSIAVGADHRGASVASELADRLRGQGVDCTLVVPHDEGPRDYPDIAYEVASRVASGEHESAVLICGTGIGMSIAANKVKGIRAAVVHDELTAELSKSHTHANVICLSADLLGQRLIEKVVDIWLKAERATGRHERRVEKIHKIESGHDPRAAASTEIEAKDPGCPTAERD